jgi:tetratricopeptide (TPR) repeat protein
MNRFRLNAVLGRLPTIILLIGLVIFMFGLLLQYSLNRPVAMTVGPISAPFGPIAMFGLAIAVSSVVAWFAVVGFMLARQTRLHGADYGRAYTLVGQMQFAEAIPLLEQSISRGKETPEVLTLLARAYAYTAQYSRAHRLIERAIELYSNSPLPYSTLGFLFLLEDNAEQAIAAYQNAVERDPTPLNYADLGLTLYYANRLDESLEALENASRQALPAQDAVRVYHRLMQLFTSKGNAARAAGAAARMVSARDGLKDWEYQVNVLKGTGYGLRLDREVHEISQALSDADATRLTS